METMTVIINWNSTSIGTLGGLAALLGLTAQPPNDLSRWSVQLRGGFAHENIG
jgi:hypothetical protein